MQEGILMIGAFMILFVTVLPWVFILSVPIAMVVFSALVVFSRIYFREFFNAAKDKMSRAAFHLGQRRRLKIMTQPLQLPKVIIVEEPLSSDI